MITLIFPYMVLNDLQYPNMVNSVLTFKVVDP